MRPGVACALVAVLALGITGCTSSREETLPDGSRARLIRCGGPLGTMVKCLAKAEEDCPRGYDMLDSGGQPYPLGVEATASFIAARTLLVRCK